MVTEAEVWEALKKVNDPELGFSVVDLGLIYEVKVEEGRKVYVKMTLTTPGCPIGYMIVWLVENQIRSLEGVEKVKVELTFDPPWSLDRISPEVRKKLGIP